MLRPEQMTKVSVTGSRAVMPAVIGTLHELGLVHLSDYDGSWEGFDNGDPIEGADEASEKLVTVRALESTLGVDSDEVDPQPTLPDDWESRLEDLRVRVNELDDERSAYREERRDVADRIDRLAPFADLGIDLDLLSGYESIDLVVGEGDRAEIETELAAADEIREFEIFAGGGDVLAIAAAPATDDAPTEADTKGLIADALVSVEFTNYEVPDVDETPASYLEELEGRKRELDTQLEDVESELATIAAEQGPFLRRVESELTVDVDRAEAPLRFATTDHAFVAEGWIPAERYAAFESSLREEVGDSVEIEQLEIAEYSDHGHEDTHETGEPDEQDRAETGDREPQSPESAAEDEAEPVKATDGGTAAAGSTGAVTMDENPPVVLDNLTPARPFEMLVKMVGQPKYSELDPTLLVFLTYPFAFGFMIGDIGYGLLYMAMGYGVRQAFDSDAGKALGTIGIWAGGFTVIFGYLYGELFGTHLEYLGVPHLPLEGSLSKGLQAPEWAQFWIILAIVFGLIHLNAGLIIGFVNELNHGLKAAVYEKLSWILSMNGLFIWIFSHQDAGSFDHGIGFLPADLAGSGVKPAFLVGATDQAPMYEFLGFAGLPEIVGIVGIVATLTGLVMVAVGEGAAGVAEWLGWSFGHVLSYLRLTAVLLAKGGMAFAINLLVWGGYADGHGHTVFNLPTYDVSGYEMEFVGLMHIGDGPLISTIAIVGGILVFVLGHILVLVLGITAAGIQMLRLEYVEFFQKFYEGGGEEYEPFGGDGAPTAD